MTKVHIIDPIHEAGQARIESAHQIVPLEQAGTFVIRTSPLGADVMARAPALRLIVKHGAGVDNIDMAEATRRGILVANTPGGDNAAAVAEGAVTLMLAVLRRVRDMDAVVREGRWDERWRLRLNDLTGARVGLIGFGRIARIVARICGQGFGCPVSAFDPLLTAEAIEEHGAIAASLEDVLTCDVISIHVPLTEGTRNLIGADQLARMGSQAIIINTSRGGIIDEPALAAALSSGAIAGAGLDVFEAEPPPADHPLFALPNVVLSPHVAGVTEASMKGMALSVADVIDTVAAGGIPATLLNPDALELR